METQPLLLCLSNDPNLLATRCLVLATRYRAVPVSSLEGLKALPTSSAFEVLVLCHSLSEAECILAVSICESRWPSIEVVTIAKSGYKRSAFQRDAMVDAFRGPIALLDSISHLLQRERLPHL